MKSQDLQNKSREELNQTLTDLHSKLLKLNFDLADNKIKDVSQIGKTKRDIARILTIMKQPQLSVSKPIRQAQGHESIEG